MLFKLHENILQGHELTSKQLYLLIQEYLKEAKLSTKASLSKNQGFTIKTPLETINAKTINQRQYLHNILTYDINFGVGPAGTGKTYLAVACAVYALQQQKVHKILLVRPVVEAGEKLGFLPGDLIQKIDPYLRPLYDALYEMLGFDKVTKLLEHKAIEIAPLAYMRGRTLNDAFIILDEGQNTTIEQMKMFLTRIGFNSKVVVTGDTSQTDLPRGKKSGLSHAEIVLKKIKEISFTYFQPTDVIRHPLVEKIIRAYSKDNSQEEK